ncbi:hypothetical protein [Okeania sp. SIO2B3]|uniref:hypothetical protein n=1 Tax=Okeania sp. SIO2B3 TaxID=2607784 RepID=UPI0013C236A8|nr:hypothetical protein [Okeania sp. SIO2B3]NET40591.1 hypothetical protein [Okeania sp. SIO2B3]
MSILNQLKALNWQNQVSVEHRFFGQMPKHFFKQIPDVYIKEVEQALCTQMTEVRLRKKFFGYVICSINLLNTTNRTIKKRGDKYVCEANIDIKFTARFVSKVDNKLGESFCRLHNVSVGRLSKYIFKETEKISEKNYNQAKEEIERYMKGLQSDLSNSASTILEKVFDI